MILRELNGGDVPALREVARLCFSELWGPDEFRNLLDNRHRLALGAWGERGLLGYFFGLVVERELDIVTVAVAPVHRGQGVAQTLIREAMKNVDRVTLEVAESNQAARGLYKKMGFVETGIRPKYYRGVENGIRMALDGAGTKTDTSRSGPTDSD